MNALLRSQFVEFEIVVINDGSTDATLAALIGAFGLVRVDRVPRSNIPTLAIHGVYASPLEPRIVVIDKQNGGKADSLNAGIKHATYPLFCAVDADTILDAGALSRLVWEFQAAPETVAVGGIVRIVNGSSSRTATSTRCARRATCSRTSRSSSTCARSSAAASAGRRPACC